MMCRRFGITTFVSAVALGVFATDYYVGGDNASDDNGGSADAPFATLDKAISSAGNSDDVIYVTPGEYTTTTQYGPNLKAKMIGTGASRGDVVIKSSAGYRTLRTTVGAWIENVTIVGNPTSSKVDKGGAIEMSGGTVTNCVITGGTAYGNTNRHCGGNLYMNATSILVVDCEISGGQARKHGGNICIDGGGTVRNCTITGGVSGIDSTTDEPRGANVYMYKGVLENCTITGGTGAERAGNVYLGHADATVRQSTITGGKTSGHGGNIFMTAGTVSDCQISDGVCQSNEGGNIHMQGGMVSGCAIANGRAGTNGGNVRMNKGTLADCTVSGGYCGGTAWDQGGGNIFANPGRIVRCVVTGGSMTEGKDQGGGIRSRSADTVIEDCLVKDNSNGGVCLEGKGKHYNNTIVNNTAYGYWGYGSNPGVFVNNIVYGNHKADGTANDWSGNRPAVADMYNCAFSTEKLAGDDVTRFANCHVLKDASCFRNATEGDWHLVEGCGLADAGATDSRADASATDLDGNPRTSGPVDIGCYELQKVDMTVSMRYTEPLAHLYVPVTASFTAEVEHAPTGETVTYTYDFGDGGSATTTDSVITHEYTVPGVYTVKITATSASARAEMVYENYVNVGSKTLWVNAFATPTFPYDTIDTGFTTLAAALAGAVEGAEIHVAEGVYEQTAKLIVNKGVRIVGDESDPSKVVFRNTETARSGSGDHRVFSVENAGAWLCGLTMEGGSVYHGNGGNLTISAGVVSNCVIRGGVAIAGPEDEFGMGAGVALSGSGVVTHCMIVDNEVQGCASGKWICGGAVVFPWGSAGKLRNCLVADNRWKSGTGEGKPGQAVDPEDPAVTNVVPVIVNGGAGLVYHGSTNGSTVENCTIVANVIEGNCAGDSAAGIRCDWNSVIRNTVIAGNRRDDDDGCEDQLALAVSNVHLIFAEDVWKDKLDTCYTEDELPSGNASCKTADLTAMFKNFASADYRPRTGGALIDHGKAFANAEETDLAGNPRVFGKAIDVGCYECQRNAGLVVLVQ